MKKTHLLNAVIAFVLTIFSVPVVIATTSTGYFNITATVTAGSCTVPPSSTQDLGDFSPANFSTSSYKQFSINLTNCPIGQQYVSIRVTGTTENGNFKNVGSASGVAIQLNNSVSSKNLATNSYFSIFNNSGNVTILLDARLIGTGTPTPGTVLATITLTYSYR